MNANLDTMPPRLREGALTDDDRMLYLMDEISRGARRAYEAGIAKRLELESATIGQAVAGLCGKGLMERRRAKTDGRAWQLILTQELDRLLPQLRESADGLHRVLWRNATRDEKRTLLDILVRIASNLDQSRTDAE